MTLRRPLPLALAALATVIAVQVPSLGLLVGSAKGAPANIILFDSSGTLVQTSDTAWSLSLIGEVRTALPPAHGHPARHDYEYQRNGTANVFVAVDAHQRRRYTKVTARRTAVDFAEWLRDLVDLHYAGTERILLVLDNLSTHTPAALYEAFPPAEARRLCSRLEFHYVPKHASWLNMVEIEIGILSAQCLDRRIPDLPTLTDEVDAWTRARNAAGARIRWMFGIEQARTKLGRAYPTAACNAAARRRAPSRSCCSRWNAMRCADLAPTPGKRRSASSRSCSARSVTR